MNYDHLKAQYSKFRPLPYRRYQEEAIEFAIQSTKPISIIWSPTGSGKSLMGTCIGAHWGEYIYLVSSKQLQNQLVHDFPEMEVLKGRNNYDCLLLDGYKCDECIHSSMFRCPSKRNCIYEVQKNTVLESPYRLLNYHYYLTESNYIGKFSRLTDLIICDEGDAVESLLTDFISLSIPGYVIRNLRLNPPKYKALDKDHKLQQWIDWASSEGVDKTTAAISRFNSQLKDLGEDSPSYPKILKRVQKLSTIRDRLKMFAEHADDEWIYEEQESRNRKYPPTRLFRPIWVPEALSEKYFFQHAKKFVFMSATFPPPAIIGKLLGRKEEDIDFIDMPSNFPVENRRIWLNPVANLTAKTFNSESTKTVDEVNRIINLKENRYVKGIIHSVSYKLSNLIMEIGDPRMVSHNSKDRDLVIRGFVESDRPKILVSPSIERGVDLADELCRFIIWAKAPFLSLGDKLTSKRVYSGNLGSMWYRSLTAQVLLQGCGRGVRHKEDWSRMYCLDQQINDLILKNRKLFPQYFLEAVEIL